MGVTDETPAAAGQCEPAGDAVALLDDSSVSLLYEQVRHIARRFRRKGFYSDSLAATDLAHEAFAKILGDMPDLPFESERHLLNMAAKAMHRLLIDRLRRRTLRKAALEEIAAQTDRLGKNAANTIDLRLDFAEKLDALEQRRPRAAEAVRYKFFFGMTLEEIAEKLECSVSAVYRELAFARAFLARPQRHSATPPTPVSSEPRAD